MKKLYFLVCSFCVTINIFAQPTITSVAVPQVGYSYAMASDTTPADLPSFTVSPGSSSAQTWDYSMLFNNTYGETTTFQSPSGGAGASNFPSANLAFQSGTDWYYLIGNSSGLLIDGAYVTTMSNTVAADYVPNAVMFNTPSTLGYNSHVVSVATFTVLYSGQTFLVKRTADRSIDADAYGSLTTPAGTYANTLRYKTYEKTMDSIFVNVFGSWSLFQQVTDSTWSYRWAQNSADAQLMTIDVAANGTTSKAQYLQSFSYGIAQYAQASTGLTAYPNPASTSTEIAFEVKTSGPVTVQLYDMSGRAVGDLFNHVLAAGRHSLTVDVERLHLPSGMYQVQISAGGTKQNLKLSIN